MSDSLIITPTYNEKENIEKIIRKVFSLPKEFHIFPKSAHCLGMVQSDKAEYIKVVTDFLDKYLAK